jgi:ankyrin repeat protein
VKGKIIADVNYKVENYWTALHIACYKGNLTMVNMLLFNGAEIESKTKGKVTPLMIAS